MAKAHEHEKTDAELKEEAQQQHEDQIHDAAEGLAAQGFSKKQIADQLSSKFAITVDEVTALIGKDGEDEAETTERKGKRDQRNQERNKGEDQARNKSEREQRNTSDRNDR